MATVLFGVGVFGLFFVFLSIRILLKKNGEFKGTCASQNPFLNKDGQACGFCGKTVTPGENCGNPDSEVNKVLAKY
ncbi:MAG: hypothetical protein AAF551_07045 [Bacteroidota bacterium]